LKCDIIKAQRKREVRVMKLKEFWEKSYGISKYEIWYRGIVTYAKGLKDIQEQLLDKTIEELEFEENNGQIRCIIELVD
jgi:hypothetical protein